MHTAIRAGSTALLKESLEPRFPLPQGLSPRSRKSI